MLALALAFGGIIGLTLGMLGGGGSILTVPVFAYVLKMPAKEAIAMSLPVVGVASLVGAAGHWRAGNVAVKTALVFGAISLLAAYAGARLSAFVPGAVQLVILGVVMLSAAISMLRGSPDAVVAGEERSASPALVGAAIAVGVLTGIVGVGGGFLIVPALVLLARVPMHRAIGTSLLVIAINTTAAFVGQPALAQVRWGLLLSFTAAAVAGISIGSRLAPRVPAASLKRAFAALLIVMAIFIIAKEL